MEGNTLFFKSSSGAKPPKIMTIQLYNGTYSILQLFIQSNPDKVILDFEPMPLQMKIVPESRKSGRDHQVTILLLARSVTLNYLNFLVKHLFQTVGRFMHVKSRLLPLTQKELCRHKVVLLL